MDEIHDVLAKGSRWTLTIDGETDTLKLLGGRGSRTRDGGWTTSMDVEWGGRPGTLEGEADSQNREQRVTLRVKKKDGREVTCEGTIDGTGQSMAGSTRYPTQPGQPTGAWFATKSSGVADTTPPKLRIAPSPSSPTTDQQVTFVVRARDPSGVARIDIMVNGRRVKTCEGPACRYVGGPFRAGTVSYKAHAYDREGNRASTRQGRLTVRAAETKPPSLRVRVERDRMRPSASATTIHGPAEAKPPEVSIDQPPDQPSTEQTGSSSISGRITGERRFAKKVSAFDLENPRQRFTATVDASGQYRIDNLPDGRYRVYPLSGGKVEVISEPRHRDVVCQGEGSHTVNFDVKGVFEG